MSDDLETTSLDENQERIDALNQRLLLAVRGSGFGVWEFDPETGRLIWDSTMCALYGMTAETFDGSAETWRNRLHPEDRELVDRRFSELLAGGNVELFEFRILRASDNTVRFVEANGSAQLDRNGRVVKLVGMNRDATDRRLTEAAKRQSEARFESLLNSSDAIVWEGDPETLRFTFVSARAERLLGYPPERWLHESDFWKEHIHPDDREATLHACRESARTLVPRLLEYRMMAADGNVVWVEDRVSVYAERGRAKLLRGVMVDVSERRLLTERLRRAEKMEMIGQFAGGIAHDFNNILAAMTLHLEQLRTGDAAPQAELASELSALTRRASALTSQLLTFARRHELSLSRFDVTALLRDTLRMLTPVLGPSIAIDFKASGNHYIDADSKLIEQAIVELCINARDAMPDTGTLTIEVGEGLPVWPTVDAPGAMVHIRFKDTGHGMEKGVLEHVFEPFFTTKEIGKGTGLGLASVYGTIRQHGGRVLAVSAPGKGTTFELFLPRASSEDPRPPKPATLPLPGGTETVLLVEDEPAVRRLTARMLDKLGYRVLAASDAAEARRVWGEHRATIDLLFADIMMPGGVSGLQLSDELRAEQPTLKVLLMTGGRRGTEGRFALADAPALLNKPFGKKELATAVRTCLDGTRRPVTAT